RHLPERTRRRLVRETLPPAGAWWLRDRLDERVRVSTGQHLGKVVEHDDGVALTTIDRNGQGLVTEVEHVIAATGYVPDLERLTFLTPELRARVTVRHGSPVLRRDFESSMPGLYFTGLAAASAFGPVMRFVHGADFTARPTSHHVVRRMARLGAPAHRRDPALEPHLRCPAASAAARPGRVGGRHGAFPPPSDRGRSGGRPPVFQRR